jgi:hypothetical protein
MRDPHTKESRGFGFVKMVTSDQADAAKEGLQGEVHQGRTLSIEKARRARPRTPTPGKYYGPPKRGKYHIMAPTSSPILTAKKSLVAAEAVDAEALAAMATATETTAEAEVAMAVVTTMALAATTTAATVEVAGTTTALVV